MSIRRIECDTHIDMLVGKKDLTVQFEWQIMRIKLLLVASAAVQVIVETSGRGVCCIQYVYIRVS